MYVLGIDVGGTNSVCLLADHTGHVIATGRGRGANLHAAGEAGLEKALQRVISTAMAGLSPNEAKEARPAAVALGVAGVDREREAAVVRGIMQRLGYSSGVVVVNDALIALVAGAGNGPGIAIISGTGSIAYGRNARNVAARAGGWGHIIGDEGSRYWIGREALAAVMRASDGRGPATALTREILTHFNVDDESRLPRIVYDREMPRMRVAALGPLVQRVVEQGDAVTTRILERAADELVLAARSVAAQLEMRGDEFTVYLAGGVFRVVPWLAEELPRRLAEVAPRSQVQILNEEPAVGAVWLALAEARGGARVPRYKSVMANG